MSEFNTERLNHLIVCLQNNTITQEEFNELKTLLNDESVNKEDYVEVVELIQNHEFNNMDENVSTIADDDIIPINITGNAKTADTAIKLATARTITIGGTSKTFDGSSNVSFTVSELGASASGHTHNYAGSDSAGGAANSAKKLTTGRTLTIGSTGKTFDGSANVAWTLTEIGAAAASHTHNYAGSGSAGGAANSATKLATARTINGTSFDGSANITTANWGTARNISISDSDGTNTGTAVSVNGGGNATLKLPATIKAALSGNASTASSAAKLTTARTLTIGSTGKTFDGSANVAWTLTEIGAAAASHTHNYAGSSSAGGVANSATKLATARTLTIGASGKTFDGTANVSWSLQDMGILYNIPATNGSASSYTRICTMPLVGEGFGTLSAIISGGSNFGSPGNPSILLSFSTRGYNGTGNPPSNLVNATRIGHVGSDIHETQFITRYVDNKVELWIRTSNYPYQIKMLVISNVQGTITCDSSTTTAITGTMTTHSIATAYTTDNKQPDVAKLTTARTLTIGSTGKTFDGSANVAWTLTEIGAAAASHTHNYAGSSSAGGVANSAAKLSTARTLTIGSKGKTFDGSANVSWTLAEIGAAAASHTHNYAGSGSAGGAANSATKLATARTLTIGNKGNTFDGSANVTWSLADIGAAASSHTHNYAGSSSAGGVANSAAKLSTARTFTIGSSEKSFDGSANVAWTLAEIGAAASSHTHNYAGSGSAGGAANSATKLATARTINGVSFNGTANIEVPVILTGPDGLKYTFELNEDFELILKQKE